MIDAYSYCPGGTGKKIKFCCGDFLAELQKIDRMFEGEQFLACLQQIDRLLAQPSNRDRACLLAFKCSVLAVTGQGEAAKTAVADFLARHPDNQVALAESAVVAAPRDVRGALGLLQRAVRAADGKLAGRTYEALGFLATVLIQRGLPLPARALLELQCDIMEDDQRAQGMLSAISRATEVPLLLREEPPPADAPDAAPWKDRFIEAIEPAQSIDWQTAADRLAVLAAEVHDAPAIWQNLVIYRGRLADNPGAADAWRRYAALRAGQADGWEDAIEAEATAMLLGGDPLGDRINLFKVVWTVKDAERANEAFLSSPRFRPIPFDPAHFSDGQTPPPKGVYMVLDRPAVESSEGLSLGTLPRVLGHALLFGRQTDREARLEMAPVAADDLAAATALLRETAGEAIELPAKQDAMGHRSASQAMLRGGWLTPRDATPEQFDALMSQHARDVILDRWPDMKLGVLDGRTPRDAAGDQALRVRVLAAIMVLEHWAEGLPAKIDFNELRTRLGLPALGPVDLQERPLMDLPLVRLGRLRPDGLSDEDLISAHYRAGAFAIRPAMRKFAQAIVDRPSLADSDERQHAFATLARTAEDLDQALDYVAQGRRAAEAKGQPHASWDLMELSFHFAHRDGPNAVRMLEHIQRRHVEEPGVGEALTQMMIDVGLLNPDGTPVAMPEQEPEMAGAAEPAAAPGGLWTPDSAQPGSSGGKLWTPE